MKKNIRRGVFETNSSSTHSLCIVSKEEFERYKKGESVYDGSELIEFTEEIKKSLEDEEEDASYEYQTWENLGYEENEVFVEQYKTKNGEEFVAFGYFGRGG